MADTKNCKNCYYFKRIHGCTRCCCYIFIEDKRRPCEPGAKCTVKIPRRRYNELHIQKGG